MDAGCADVDGKPSAVLPPMHIKVDITAAGRVTRMTITATLPSSHGWEQMLSMGTDVGMSQAVGQIDDILVELATGRGEREARR